MLLNPKHGPKSVKHVPGWTLFRAIRGCLGVLALHGGKLMRDREYSL